jgi:hypothetical protein
MQRLVVPVVILVLAVFALGKARPAAGQSYTAGTGFTATLPFNATLANDLELRPVAARGAVNAVIALPSAAAVSVSGLPSWITATQSGASLLVGGTAPVDAVTARFTVTRGGVPYRIVQPVSLGIAPCDGTSPGTGPLSLYLTRGAPASVQWCGSGGEGVWSWTFTPSAGTARAPAGLALALPNDPAPATAPVATSPSSTSGLSATIGVSATLSSSYATLLAFSPGRASLTGTVATGATTVSGTLRLADGRGRSVARSLRMEVAPHFGVGPDVAADGVQRWRRVGPAGLTKYVAVSLPLPAPRGGDGSYTWTLPTQPGGLSVVSSPSGPRLQGTLPASTRLGTTPIVLEVRSPGHFLPATLRFDASVLAQELGTFSVLTQNTLLRPPELPDWAEELATGGGAGAGWIVGSLLGPFGLIGAAAGAIASNLAAEEIYDWSVQNTDADNLERTDLLEARLLDKTTRRMNGSGPIDFAALQEVFDENMFSKLQNDLAGSYSMRQGPPALDHKISSGLASLVRHARFQILGHQRFPFEVVDPDSSDALANKGFSVTTVQLKDAAGNAIPDAIVRIVNLHTDANESDPTWRMNQFDQIAAHLDGLPATHPILLTGDFNVQGESLPNGVAPTHTAEYDLLMDILHFYGSWWANDPELAACPLSPRCHLIGYADVYRQRHPLASWQIGPDFAVRGITNDARRNPYSASWFPGSPPKRLDYMIVRQGTAVQLRWVDIAIVDDLVPTTLAADEGWIPDAGACQADQRGLDGTPFGARSNDLPAMCSYLSDHYGLRGDFRLVRE